MLKFIATFQHTSGSCDLEVIRAESLQDATEQAEKMANGWAVKSVTKC